MTCAWSNLLSTCQSLPVCFAMSCVQYSHMSWTAPVTECCHSDPGECWASELQWGSEVWSACLQVLTVHSPFRIENCTNTPLEFVVHMFMGAGQSMPSLQARAAATAHVPTSGPLLPGLQCYLPAPAIWCGAPLISPAHLSLLVLLPVLARLAY